MLKNIFKISALVVFMMLIAVNITAYGADDENCSVTVNVLYNEKAVENVSVELFFVGSFDTKNGAFALTDDFGSKTVTYKETQESDYAKTLQKYVESKGLKGTVGTTNSNGVVKFESLKTGLYLIICQDTNNIEISPFTASTPVIENGEYIYEVNAYPKTENVNEITQTTTGVTDSVLPQTGQNYNVVWILTVCALASFFAGFLIEKSGGKYENKA